jgi:hypothetical protein
MPFSVRLTVRAGEVHAHFRALGGFGKRIDERKQRAALLFELRHLDEQLS